MTFHSACARMLRADAHRLGYTRQFTIYDSADQRRLIKKCLDDLDIDPKRFTPRAMQVQISDAKNKLRSAEDYRQLVGSFFEQTVADVYEALRARAPPRQRDGLRRPALPRGQPARALPGGPRPLHQRVPLHPRRRVPGHQPRPVPLAPAARLRAPQPRGGRRRRAVDLRLPRRRHHEHPQFRGRLRRRARDQARAELPLDADDPVAANAVIANNRGQKVKHLWTDLGEGDPIKVRELDDEHARGAVRRGGDRAAGRRGRVAAPRSPSSTGRTRSRGCSRTCSCARRSATRSSAARSSTSARRSRTRSRT